jgi:ABC-type multidrug transport system ATPase subunit
MYAAIKKVPKDSIDSEVDCRLREVDLYHVKNALVGTFSGGMKRRMSLAISVVGDPKIVILDEPTTGMDPKARR